MSSTTVDIAILVVGAVVWAAMVLPDYMLALHLRKVMDAKTRQKGLYNFARQTWESKFLIWAAIVGGGVATLTTQQLSVDIFFAVIGAGFIAVLLIGLGSMIIASKAGYAADISDRPTRAAIYSFLGIALFSLTHLLIKWSRGQVEMPNLPEFTPLLAALGTVVGIVSGLVSVWVALRKE